MDPTGIGLFEVAVNANAAFPNLLAAIKSEVKLEKVLAQVTLPFVARVNVEVPVPASRTVPVPFGPDVSVNESVRE